MQIPFAASLPFGSKFSRQEMERCPYSGYILDARNIRALIHHLELKLCRCSRKRASDLPEQGSSAAVDKLSTVSYLQAFFRRISGDTRRTVCSVIVKIKLHVSITSVSFLSGRSSDSDRSRHHFYHHYH